MKIEFGSPQRALQKTRRACFEDVTRAGSACPFPTTDAIGAGIAAELVA